MMATLIEPKGNESQMPRGEDVEFEIWKYQINISKNELTKEFDIPWGANILKVQEDRLSEDRGRDWIINIWALVTPTNTPVPRVFKVVGTGQPFARPGEYLGTTFFGRLVLHVFEDSDRSREIQRDRIRQLRESREEVENE